MQLELLFATLYLYFYKDSISYTQSKYKQLDCSDIECTELDHVHDHIEQETLKSQTGYLDRELFHGTLAPEGTRN